MSVFSSQMAYASDQLYTTFGRSATYTTAAGVATSVTVRGRASPTVQSYDGGEWMIKASEVASPAVGDTVTVDTVVYHIEIIEPRSGGNWRLLCSAKFGAAPASAGIS